MTEHEYTGDFGVSQANVARHIRNEHPEFTEWTSPEMGQTTPVDLHRALHQVVNGFPTAYRVTPLN